MDSSTTTLWTGLFPIAGCLVFIITCFIDIPVVNANSVDPDQAPHSEVSDLGLHYLPVTLFGVYRLKCFTNVPTFFTRSHLQKGVPGVHLLHDNAPAHHSIMVIEYLEVMSC